MFLKLLQQHLNHGILHVHMPDGKVHTFGSHGVEAHWYIRRQSAMRRIASNWEFELGETYMNGDWDVGEYYILDLLAVLRTNFSTGSNRHWYTPVIRLYHLVNNIARSYRNVASHYDVDEFVFRRFLDKEMYYSCAYFRDQQESLEQAQFNKARHIGEKLLLSPGQQVLDIGCGWGSLAFHLAQHYDVNVTGITLSKEQLRVAREEASRRNIQNVHFELADYREHEGIYDRIVSVGMLEHVGLEELGTYFNCVNRLLNDDGVALIHTIGNRGVPRETNPWIEKYIFPGGRIPALSECADRIEKNRLMVADLEVLRLHYAWTLHHWHQRFLANRDEIKERKGERFCRMWEFYLAACESAFKDADLVVFQFQLAKQHGVIPVTRDYLYHPGTDIAGNFE